MDPMACNYDSEAGCDSGMCSEEVFGCDDEDYCEYNPDRGCDDFSLCKTLKGCTDSAFCNYNAKAVCDDGSCRGERGCTDYKVSLPLLHAYVYGFIGTSSHLLLLGDLRVPRLVTTILKQNVMMVAVTRTATSTRTCARHEVSILS